MTFRQKAPLPKNLQQNYTLTIIPDVKYLYDCRVSPPSVQHELKDLQYMDQSLMTVATQLLNVTTPHEYKVVKDKPKITKVELPQNILLVRNQDTKVNQINQVNSESNEKSDMELVTKINSDISTLESMGVGFGRPTNSKFGYFEPSHPGQAMAMTEEELEREISSSSTRLITAHKNYPTTTGGISTWILLNPPTTTLKSLQDNDLGSVDQEVNVEAHLQTKSMTPVNIFETTLKSETKSDVVKDSSVSLQSTTSMEGITILSKTTTPVIKIITSTAPRPTTTEKSTVSPKAEKPKTSIATTFMTSSTKMISTEATPKPITATTKKPITSSRTTTKPKITTPKSANVMSKPTKVTRATQTVKPTKKGMTKPSANESTKSPSTSKIEKVTFRPVQMITTPKSSIEIVERPIIMTKIKTSLITGTNEKQSTPIPPRTEDIYSNFSDANLSLMTLKPKPQKTNNVLKVQLKKPEDLSAKIEVEPITVRTPVLEIEKIEETSKQNFSQIASSIIPKDSQIDLKFDFNPELNRIDLKTQTESSSSITTSKRPHKRQKNKIRRRKPTTLAPTTVTSTTLTPTTIPMSTDAVKNLTELGIIDNSIQESKLSPESKVSASGTKNKINKVQKPISTQIYNFLSREVMPSFGVMSLVGLGLGLASYFLYPFGGTIARRNYVVEPNYKYNLDGYGGNYGQSEEEVFSKVLQGMTSNDGKYGGIKDYENNFYRYQKYDGTYTEPQASTKKQEIKYPTSSATNYRPIETTIYDGKYKTSDFIYPEVPTTPNYYERAKQPEYLSQNPGNRDRQFVVGNVPKEYGFEDKKGGNSGASTQSYEFGKILVDVGTDYGLSEAQTLKANPGYGEIEITPTAVAVEHGPRHLRRLMRRKRESVIQTIPSRVEIEKEVKEIEKKEPLSNEILDLIDSVIPEMEGTRVTKEVEKKTNKTEKIAAEMAKEINETIETTTAKTIEVESSEKITRDETIQATSTSSMTTEADTTEALLTTSTSTTTVKSLTIDEMRDTTKCSEKDPDDSSNEWFDQTTTQKPQEPNNIFKFMKKMAEIKLRLGIAILKHASESFAKYLGQVQKRVNGEE